MSETGPPLTRTECAYLFARRAVVHVFAFGVATGSVLLVAQAYNGVTKDMLLAELRNCAVYWFVVIPLLFLQGLSNGDLAWRHAQQPSAWYPRIYKVARWIILASALAALFLHWIATLIVLAYFAVIEVQFQRYMHAFHGRGEPDRITPVVVGVCCIGIQFWILYQASTPPSHEAVLWIQQLLATGLVALFSMHNDINYFAELRRAGRFPQQGNPHFQISLSTTLKLVLAGATWTALAVWWFKRVL